MGISLGEKLRQARESRGITISEVAEQTRIAALYLEGIESDDYRTLPGGIFNKGFVKSFAKHVGIDEQEALQDYARLISSQDSSADEGPKIYRPEVLTDDQSSSSSLLTIIFAIIILGLITWGAYTFANYYGENSARTATATPTPSPSSSNETANTNTQELNSNSNVAMTAPSEIKIEIKALTDSTSVTYNVDGSQQSQLVAPGSPLILDVKETALISYSKYQAANVQMSINSKEISLPSSPENQNRQAIDLVITKDNIVQILQKGQIAFEPDVDANSNSKADNTNTKAANVNSAAR